MSTIGCFLLILLTPLSMLLKAAVMVSLWKWFVVPFGVIEIGYAHAIGLSLAIYMFVPTNAEESADKSEGEIFGHGLMYGFIVPLGVWSIGALMASWM